MNDFWVNHTFVSLGLIGTMAMFFAGRFDISTMCVLVALGFTAAIANIWSYAWKK